MWLKAKTPIRYANDKPTAKVGDKFEVSDADAAELVACGAAEETDAPRAADEAAAAITTAAAAATEVAAAEAAAEVAATKPGKKAA
jgi:hypothetical protein